MTAKFTSETQAAIDQAEQLVEAFFAAHPELDPKTTKLEICGGKITGYETQTPGGYYAIANSPPLDLSKAPLSGDYSPYTKLFMPGAYDPQAAEDWRSKAWQTRRKLLADMAQSLNIPLELLGTPAANHYSDLMKPGETMLSPDEQAAIDQLANPNAEDWRSAAWQHRGTLPAQSAWFALTTKLKKAKETYLKIAHEAFESNNFERAAYWKALADGIDYALNLQSEIANEVRDAVGSATEPPAAGSIPIP